MSAVARQGQRPNAGAAAPAPSALAPLRILPTPRHRPPVIAETDDDWRTPVTRGPRYVQDALAVDFSLRSDAEIFGEQPTRRDDLPDPREWAGHLAQALVEVMGGVRPAPQVLRWTTPEVYAVVARRAAVSARRGMPPTRRTVVRSLRVCEPADGVAEVSAVVVDGGRVRALALRLVGLDGRWRVEALQVG
ncbi:Rv3235 family protein [Pedococcus sp. 2YAF34]|uniref:Rv3235 family protein n=1 Tax=Pedococcus sp. 2YAF34 TaxID=3233032 RepID=UPI003F9E7128